MDNFKNSLGFCRQDSCLAKDFWYKSENDVKSKLKYDICCVGRSMIEMLGVLAIIAVLSVGGIAKNCENCRTNQCRIQFLLDNNVF